MYRIGKIERTLNIDNTKGLESIDEDDEHVSNEEDVTLELAKNDLGLSEDEDSTDGANEEDDHTHKMEVKHLNNDINTSERKSAIIITDGSRKEPRQTKTDTNVDNLGTNTVGKSHRTETLSGDSHGLDGIRDSRTPGNDSDTEESAETNEIRVSFLNDLAPSLNNSGKDEGVEGDPQEGDENGKKSNVRELTVLLGRVGNEVGGQEANGDSEALDNDVLDGINEIRDLSSSDTVSEVLEEDGDLVDLLAHLGLDGSGGSSGSGKKVVGIGLVVDVETTLIFILVLEARLEDSSLQLGEVDNPENVDDVDEDEHDALEDGDDTVANEGEEEGKLNVVDDAITNKGTSLDEEALGGDHGAETRDDQETHKTRTENRADTELKGLASLDSSNDGNDNFRSSRTNSQESSTGDIFLHTPSVAKTLQSGDQLLIDDITDTNQAVEDEDDFDKNTEEVAIDSTKTEILTKAAIDHSTLGLIEEGS